MKLLVLNYNLMILNSLIFTRIRGLLAVAITAVNGQPRIKYLRSKYQINFLLSTFPLSMILKLITLSIHIRDCQSF